LVIVNVLYNYDEDIVDIDQKLKKVPFGNTGIMPIEFEKTSLGYWRCKN